MERKAGRKVPADFSAPSRFVWRSASSAFCSAGSARYALCDLLCAPHCALRLLDLRGCWLDRSSVELLDALLPHVRKAMTPHHTPTHTAAARRRPLGTLPVSTVPAVGSTGK